MTQTVGYYCDRCRRKYVRHKCKDDILPCGHDINEAIFVYCKQYGRGGEAVVMEVGKTNAKLLDASIFKKPESEWVLGYTLLWNTSLSMTYKDKVMDVGDWIKEQEGKTIRAFMARWDSYDRVPEWRLFEMWPDWIAETQERGKHAGT